MKSIRSICVAHIAPVLPAHFVDFTIGLGSYYPPRGAHVSALDGFWHQMREISYGAAGNYVVPRVIELVQPRTDLTALFFHRKFIMKSPAGREAARYPAFREIAHEDIVNVSREDLRPHGDNDFLIGAPWRFDKGIVYQYAEKHRAIDLHQYISVAAELGVMSVDDVQSFSLETHFIPGGCVLGIYPTDWLYEAAKKLELVGRVFLTRAGARIRTYDSYQVRAVDFCAERLGSYLLLKELRRRYPQGLPKHLIGYLYSVTEPGQSYSPATAVA